MAVVWQGTYKVLNFIENMDLSPPRRKSHL